VRFIFNDTTAGAEKASPGKLPVNRQKNEHIKNFT
jgi:hypothetical protein